MRSLHFLLALTIVASLGYSQCTGGLAGIPYVIAAEIGMDDGAAAMSMAPIACTGTENMSMNHEETKTTGGCKDGESCLRQLTESAAKQVATEEFFTGILEEVLPISIVTFTFNTLEENIADDQGRTGPLFERALLAAHTTVKRE